MQNNTPQEIWQAIVSAENPILTIDSRFDFDAFGSALALREVLKSQGKSIRLTYTDVVPDRAFDFMNAEGVEQDLEPSDIDFSGHDLLITIDSADYPRVSRKGEFTPPEDIKKVKIDHHGEPVYNGDLNYLRNASSACRLMWEIFKANDIKLNADSAYFLAIGLLTDSGFLQYESVDSEDYRMMADLMDSGVDTASLFWKFSFNTPLDNIRFIQLVYSHLEVDYENKWAYSFYMNEEVLEMGINKDNVYSKGADIIKRIKGIDFAFVVKQNDLNPKDYNASFRSRLPGVDVSVFAKALGGGGHKMAASGSVTDVADIKDAIEKVIEVIKSNRDLAYENKESA